ncbi:MAG: AAA family ATPase [Candidatus Altiarchaeales archaeon]|nr:AAA family ATPase [Candidatus Altiarchaeales archaeon]
MKLYVDLDHVLTDFDRQLSEMLGVDKDPGNDPKVWSKIDEAGDKFWATMPWMADGPQLWDECKKYEPTILTSPSRHDSSREGKKKWIKKNIPGTPFVVERDKYKYAEPDAVLIDDRKKNIDAWEKAGGKGILHKSAPSTIQKLHSMVTKKNAASKSMKDPKDPNRKIVVEKLRGGRGTQVIKPKKGKGSYRRKKNWRILEAAVRVSSLFLDASWADLVKEVTEPLIKRVQDLTRQYEDLRRKQPQRASIINKRFNVENTLSDAAWEIKNIAQGRGTRDLNQVEEKIKDMERVIIPSFDVGQYMKRASVLNAAHRVLLRYAAEELVPVKDFQYETHPVVIDPYDQIVQQAVNEMGQSLKHVDVIKLETTCPGNRLAWVTNEDLFQGQPGKKRIIHLCLKKIKDKFQKKHGQPYTITDQAEQSKMKEIVKRFLMDVVLPHETEHIHQEMEHGGEFGPASEPGAERAEEWKNLEQMGVKKKAQQKRTLYTLRGISGSGKSRLAKQLEEQLGVQAMSTDDYFMREGQYQFDPKQIGQAHQWNIERAVQAMRMGQPVIIDNTNTQAWEMKPYVEVALNNGYDVEFREPNWNADLKDDNGDWNIDFIEKLQENPDRAQIGKAVPREILEKMRNRYEKDVDVETVMRSKPPWEK